MNLLWLDIETNGRDENDGGYILEIGVAATTMKSNMPLLWSYTALVWTPGQPNAMRPTAPKVVQDMHDANGLWDAYEENPPTWIADVEQELLTRMGVNEKWAIAGSGVAHFDMRFIKKFMPRLAAACAYYQYDIGPVRRFFKIADKESLLTVSSDASTKTHRALDDAYQHLMEARHIVKLIRSLH